MSDLMILVDNNDKEIGFIPKEDCHKNPVPLHRAFSIFIFNKKGQLLVQKRCSDKKTWGGIWSNTCCSHPRKGEKLEEAAKRRLKEEMGFESELKYLFHFTYDAVWNKTWGEHELDHVFIGHYDGKIEPNNDEIEDYKWVDTDELRKDIKSHPEKYTPWFMMIIEKVVKEIK